MALKASDISFGSAPKVEKDVSEAHFRELGEGRYSLELLPAGITFEVDRLRREHHALKGELAVIVRPGALPHARANIDPDTQVHYISPPTELNFSAPRSITERANILKERSGASDSFDWYGLLSQFVFRITTTERRGKPSVILADIPDEPEDKVETWDVSGIPILPDLPMVLFGAGSSGKSYIAMHVAGTLALQGVNVLYCDWEFSERDHRKRLARLFVPMPKNLHYISCDRPISDEIDRIVRIIRSGNIQYVIYDSMIFALGGPSDDEHAAIYFRAIRTTRVGGLHIAHTAKGQLEEVASKQHVFGSIFFENGARSVWYCAKAEHSPRGEHYVGLYHRKSNVGELIKPRGLKLIFRGHRTLVEKMGVDESDELSASLPLLERMTKALSGGAMTRKQIAEDLNVPDAAIRSMLSRHKSRFIKIGNKIGLLGDSVDF